jgi:hypothetical protein
MSYQIALSDPVTGAVGAAGVVEALEQQVLPAFYALGDSFSSGIGANCGWIKDEFDADGDCFKCNGAYPYQIVESAQASDNFSIIVHHLGCSGASMNDIDHRDWKNRSSQIDLMESKSGQGGWGTLSIGGNDVGFASIVSNCIMFDKPSCDADMNNTEDLISNSSLLSDLNSTYLTILDSAATSDFTLIVPGYAQLFNATTSICNNQYFFYGRYLTKEFRARINTMIVALNLIIQRAVQEAQRHLVNVNSRKRIFYEDWDHFFSGHRFCEPAPKTWADAWFFTIYGSDILPNGTVVSTTSGAPSNEFLVDVNLLARSCASENQTNLTAQMLCDWALNLAKGIEPNEDVSTLVYPGWITKTMHPKSIAHWKLGKMIYHNWRVGKYA